MSRSMGGHLAALVTILIWGSTFVVTKVLLVYLSATQILVVRFLGAALVLLPFSRGFFRWAGWRTEFWWFLAGLTGVTSYYLAENAALARTSATDVGLISTTIPLLTALASRFVEKGDRLSVRTWTGIIAAAFGVFIVMGNGLILGRQPWGDALALGAALAFTAYSLVIRKLPQGVQPLVTVTRSFFWGTLAALPFLSIDGGWPPVSVLASLPVLESLTFLTLAASVVAYALWNRAINILGMVKANAYIYTVPVVNTALGAIFLAEPVTLLTVAGCALVIGGVAWGGLSFAKHRCPTD